MADDRTRLASILHRSHEITAGCSIPFDKERYEHLASIMGRLLMIPKIASLIDSYQAAPVVGSASTMIFGTKQKRFGCPAPEATVHVQNYVKGRRLLHFFIPWGSRKQIEGYPIDLLEFFSVEQLASLQRDLAAAGYESHFWFRVENLTDYWLFPDSNFSQVDAYAEAFHTLCAHMFKPGTHHVRLESEAMNYDRFYAIAKENAMLFFLRLGGCMTSAAELKERGWQGNIPPKHKEFYFRQYKCFCPEQDPYVKLSEYFASALTRVMMNGTLYPTEPFIFITFGHPIPGNPIAPNRLFYRTLPRCFTNNHRAPWLSKCVVHLDGSRIIPKCQPYTQVDNSEQNTVTYGGVELRADYTIE